MVHVFETIALNAGPDDVWSAIGDFGALDSWHPMVEKCQMRDNAPSDQLGAIRELKLVTGAPVVESLTARSEDGRTYSYDFVEVPFPISNYLSTIRVRRGPEPGLSLVEWESNFDTPAETEADLTSLITKVYTSGFQALKERFGA